MAYNSCHPSLGKSLPIWRKVRDAVAGQEAIKLAATRYLPMFVPEDQAHYDQFIQRAYFMGVTGRTLEKLSGAVFRERYKREIPQQIEYIEENADGAGMSLEMVAKRGVDETLTVGRVAFYVDYPPAEPGMSLAESNRLGLSASINMYDTESIINWKTGVMVGREVLTLAVLQEAVDDSTDEFSHNYAMQYRVLRLRDGVFTVQVYGPDGVASEEFTPLDASGQPFDHIPLYTAGAKDNRPHPDKPPLLDMANLNIAHYVVTASHMENLFLHGQVTLGISSKLDFKDFSEANPEGVRVGAMSGHFLGEGGSFTTATAPESSSLRVALSDLQEQMVSIGASLVQRDGAAETAEGRRMDMSSEHSVLETVVGNVSEAIEAALEDCARFMGGDPDAVQFALNRQFFEDSSSDKLSGAKMMAEINKSMMGTGVPAPFTDDEIRRQAGYATDGDDSIEGEIV